MSVKGGIHLIVDRPTGRVQSVHMDVQKLYGDALSPRKTRPSAPPEVVHRIRERFHIDHFRLREIQDELETCFSAHLTLAYIHLIAIGARRRNVPYSQKIIDWLQQTKRGPQILGG